MIKFKFLIDAGECKDADQVEFKTTGMSRESEKVLPTRIAKN